MKRTRTAALLLPLVLLVAGCGSDGNSASDTSAAATDAQATEDSGASDTEVADSDVLAGDCADESAIQGAFSSMNPDDRSPEERRADFERALAYLDAKGDSAPADLADDFELVEGYSRALFGVLETLEFDPKNIATKPEVATDMTRIASEFDQAQLPVSLGLVSRYVAENC